MGAELLHLIENCDARGGGGKKHQKQTVQVKRSWGGKHRVQPAEAP